MRVTLLVINKFFQNQNAMKKMNNNRSSYCSFFEIGQYGLVQKRRHEEKEYDEEKGIFIGSSDGDNSGSEGESEEEEEDNDCVEKESKETIKVLKDLKKQQK